MSTVYIETSIVSHAAARPSSDVQIAALQKQARDWWANERPKFHLVTSQLTVAEASAGDATAAAERMELLDGLPLVPISDDVRLLAEQLVSPSMMPEKAAADALHVATAAVSGVEYLLTLNCKHIANAHVLPRVYDVLGDAGYERLLICTPAEFLGDPNDDEEPDT